MLLATSQSKLFNVFVRQGQRSFASIRYRNVLSQQFVPTTKENANKEDKNVKSVDLMLRSGLLRQSSSGIYSLLPFAVRTLEKLERIIDEEMRSVGGQKVSLPLLLSPEGWKATGRWESTGKELFKLQDRKGSEFCLAPTHEEEITQLVANEVSSYRQLPVRLYQIGNKYRDELRPRSGLLRGREFIMKDLYTFDATEEEAQVTYDLVKEAYHRIFTRVAIPFAVAEADSGNIGGSKSHEFHFVSQAGEDSLISCRECGYTANEERAIGKIKGQTEELGSVLSQETIDKLRKYSLHWSVSEEEHPELSLIVTEKGRQINGLKVKASFKPVKLLTEEQMLDWLSQHSVNKLNLLLDDSVRCNATAHEFENSKTSQITDILRGNQIDTHMGDFHNTKAGDACPHCVESRPLSVERAVEVGHTFLLGTKYSALLNATYQPADSVAKVPMQMGCYGIGVSRLLAAIVESSHDSKGIVWPPSVAPYRMCLIPLVTGKHAENDQMLTKGTEELYDRMHSEVGWLRDELIIDDRKGVSAGFRMKDAELIGYPWSVVIGKSYLKDGKFELQIRQTGEKQFLTKDELVNLFRTMELNV
ncbi:prolyl-tRNA synthetase [Basidiobolus meristosporus CBS 931.73]|uniref:proline--tRNA ligase n=1 Tax=Basidiobolus meristosporus CBS 931.73 TaxID=1314790 RepID=A0A1Y1Y874_9FUNG|nr:prolyl-tRNA synthetase [Basidiobolus meristosporus CBS 931.73]|eukprot:ORX93784.1 prolyl-tRNA synthetase [Basidiobolus meristosporus CBS 931.73]